MQQSTTHTTHPGRIEVITGPMFSGKSEELIRRLKRAQIAKRRVICFKPDLDVRYHRTATTEPDSSSAAEDSPTELASLH